MTVDDAYYDFDKTNILDTKTNYFEYSIFSKKYQNQPLQL